MPVKAPQMSHTVCTGLILSVLYGQEKTMWKSRPNHLLLFYHCILIVYECIYDMEHKMHFMCCTKMVDFPKSDHV